MLIHQLCSHYLQHFITLMIMSLAAPAWPLIWDSIVGFQPLVLALPWPPHARSSPSIPQKVCMSAGLVKEVPLAAHVANVLEIWTDSTINDAAL